VRTENQRAQVTEPQVLVNVNYSLRLGWVRSLARVRATHLQAQLLGRSAIAANGPDAQRRCAAERTVDNLSPLINLPDSQGSRILPVWKELISLQNARGNASLDSARAWKL